MSQPEKVNLTKDIHRLNNLMHVMQLNLEILQIEHIKIAKDPLFQDVINALKECNDILKSYKGDQ